MSLKLQKGLNDLFGKHMDLKVFGVFILMSVGLAWIADGIVELIYGDNMVKALFMIISSSAIFYFVYNLVQRLKDKYDLDEVVDIKNSIPTEKRSLIIFLSDHENIDELTLPKDLSETKLNSGERDTNLGRWQMPLMAINFHSPRLERCVVLTSKDSQSQVDKFIEIVNNLFGSKLKVTSSTITNLGDPNAIIDGYRKSFTHLKEKEDFPENEIVIDVTSGTKLVTIAGSFYALAKDRLIEYVDTQDYSLKMFNNQVVSPDSD